jgi:hypothetical protein
MKQLILILAMLMCGAAHAGERWSGNIAAQTTVVGNSGSLLRAAALESGMVVSADYLEDRGLTLGYTNTAVQFLQSLPQVNQQAIFLSLREHFYSDLLGGRFTLRADGHVSANDDASGLTDDVRAGAIQTSYLGNDKQLYVDVGYARSNYASLLTVSQLTPTFGLALQQDAAWLQLRGYLIEFSDAALAQGFSRTNALELKYSYWLMPGSSYFKPHSVVLSALAGKRLFAVDMDAGSVANLADLQTGGLALGVSWKLDKADKYKLMLLGGQNRYENVSLGNKYRGNFVYANWNMNW